MVFPHHWFSVTGLKILGKVGTHTFLSGKKYNFMHFERNKIISFQENLKKNLGFTSKFR